MTSSAVSTSLRKRISSSMAVFLDLSDGIVLGCARELCMEIASLFSEKNRSVPLFQCKNSKSLIRRIEVVAILLDCLNDLGSLKESSTSIFLFLKEMHLLLYRYRVLIDYIKGSSNLWLLLQNSSISSYFHDMNKEMSTLLDVLPLNEINLPLDVMEHVLLLRKQSRKSMLFLDKHGDMLRLKLYCFMNDFENGIIPQRDELYAFFVENIKIYNVERCRAEIEFLEEQIVNHDGVTEPTTSVLDGLVALMRYIRFLLFRFEDEDGELGDSKLSINRRLISLETANIASMPKDFCCPISLDLMHDPVLVSTGQTYDRASIVKWFEEGHLSCPKTGQVLIHTELVPNQALRNLIWQWCMAYGIQYDLPENGEFSLENSVSFKQSKAAIEATKATASLLVQQLENGTQRAKTVAAKEIRLMAKSGRQNRASIAEAGAIPFLNRLLSSADASTQENSVTALLNLSIYEINKGIIMESQGCLCSIVDVLRNGQTTDARENAAATLFSLSVVHVYKQRIAEQDGALSALIRLLQDGTNRGKHDAVTALFNLSTHPINCTRILESEAVPALVTALRCEGVSEEAAGALAQIMKHPAGAEAVTKEPYAIVGLTHILRYGTQWGKENATAALLELCRNGGVEATERVLKTPFLASCLHSLLHSGTKRAKRKAASLAKFFRRFERSYPELPSAGYSHAFAGTMDSSYAGDVSFPIPVPAI